MANRDGEDDPARQHKAENASALRWADGGRSEITSDRRSRARKAVSRETVIEECIVRGARGR